MITLYCAVIDNGNYMKKFNIITTMSWIYLIKSLLEYINYSNVK